jgi:hypothetical protein
VYTPSGINTRLQRGGASQGDLVIFRLSGILL